ncbi:MAG: glycosyltransferase [bacterium]
MRVLLSTIGSRGDVQPLAAVAVQLRALGHAARVCAPPNFGEWIEGLGIPFVPIGPDVRSTAKQSGAPRPEQIRAMMDGTVATQFATIPTAAEGCDVIVGANPLQIAARSVAEHMSIPYVFAAYCPVSLPSPHHAPPRVPAWTPLNPTAGNLAIWTEDAERWNERWSIALNSQRAAIGLSPVSDVRDHILTDAPWLAADRTLAPWFEPSDLDVFQTGAWILPDDRPLSTEIEAFLDAGDAPIYFGLGSVRAPEDVSIALIAAARSLGRRVMMSRGWADLSLVDDQPDCLSIGDVNQQRLFSRVAAVVHHGGAGTTTAATRSGAPQLVMPQHYDQHYFAQRVDELGIGSAHACVAPTTQSLSDALDQVLHPNVAVRARSIATKVSTDGALIAAQRLIEVRGKG